MSKKCDLLGIGPVSGNNVSHSNRKTKRRFLPNLKEVSLKSDALGVNLNLKIAATTIRTINKYGNIDNFLVNYRHAKLAAKGQSLRIKVKRKLEKLGKLDEVKTIKAIKTVKNIKEKKVIAKKAK